MCAQQLAAPSPSSVLAVMPRNFRGAWANATTAAAAILGAIQTKWNFGRF
jgi:hypothetical protein